jgi:hypothetical protein
MKTANTQLAKKPFHSTRLRTIRIPATDLRMGMYVGKLDRPWTETPFLLQGFVMKNTADIDKMNAYCEYVYVEQSYTPKQDNKPKLRILKTSTQRPGVTHAANALALRRSRRFLASSFTMRLLLLSLLLSHPLQASAEWHHSADSSLNSAQAR